MEKENIKKMFLILCSKLYNLFIFLCEKIKILFGFMCEILRKNLSGTWDIKRFYGLYNFVFVALLLLLGGLTLFSAQKNFSENENRYLERKPEFSIKAVANGDYQEKMSRAMEDQFPARDFLMKAATVGEKAMGCKDIGGVYLGDDNYYITKTLDSDLSRVQFMKNLRYTEYFGKLAGNTTVILVPSAGIVLKDKLPKYGTLYNADDFYYTANQFFEYAMFLDIRRAVLDNKYKQLYYRTDHHWTLSGAYMGYEALCVSKGVTPKPYAEFMPKKMTSDFYGTLYSKTLDPAAVPDEIYAPHGALMDNVSMVVDDLGSGEEKPIYDEQKLKEKDKYAYFFGGNYGKVTIKTGSQTAKGKKLLVVKDSFANTFVPFLMEDYSEITMIDLRYYNESVQKLLKKGKYTDTLVLYEMSGYANDKNLFKLVQ